MPARRRAQTTRTESAEDQERLQEILGYLNFSGGTTREPVVPDTSAEFRLDSPYSWLILLGIAPIVAVILADWRVLRPKTI